MTSGASAADVRSILAIPGPSNAAQSSLGSSASFSNSAASLNVGVATASKGRKLKPDGISRELYALIGPSAPTLTAQLSKPKFKPKPNLSGGGKAAKWCASLCLSSQMREGSGRFYRVWHEFSNQARKDGLKLSHWVKATPQQPSGEGELA